MDFFENDKVKSLVTKEGVPLNSIGTIICVFEDPNEAYEVEFLDNDGYPLFQETYLPNEIEKIVL